MHPSFGELQKLAGEASAGDRLGIECIDQAGDTAAQAGRRLIDDTPFGNRAKTSRRQDLTAKADLVLRRR